MKLKRTVIAIILSTSIAVSSVSATGYPVFDISGWLTAIDQLYQQYDMVMNTITQIENQYQQIQQAVERAKSIDWDNIRFDGDFDIRNDIKDANKRVNKLLNQTRQIKNTLTSPNIDCGNGRYSLADLCGMGSPDHNFFSACKDVEAYMTDSMKFSIDAIEGNLTEKQKMMIWRKYGISPKNYLFVQQSVAQVKTQASKLMAKATDEAVQLQREDRIAKTNAIIQAGQDRCQDATIYIWGHNMICILCKRFIVQSGITHCVLQKDENSPIVRVSVEDLRRELEEVK